MTLSGISFKDLYESANSIILLWDKDGKIRSLNDYGLQFFGYTAEEIAGQSVLTLLPPDGADSDFDPQGLVQQVLSDPDKHVSVPALNVTKDGRQHWVAWSNKALRDEQGEFREILAVGNDITRLKELEDELRSSEERYRHLNESMVQPMALHEIICDAAGKPVDYRFLDVNPAMESLLGRPASEIIGHTVMELIPGTEAHWVETFGMVALTGKSAHFENHSEVLDKYFDVVAYSPRENQFAIVATDITDRVKMREQQRVIEDKMYQAQKLESLGVLAGGIAHDFNNILMAILGNTDLALMRLAPESPVQENLKRIESAAMKAADLARQMLAYSGKGKFVVESVNLNRVLEEMLHILKISISKHAVLRLDYSPLIPTIEADTTQLQQIVMNLVINASEAIGERSGVIAISTGVMDCDQQYLMGTAVEGELPEGPYAYFEIADTGCGMDKDTLQQIFDPFFTTKFTGRGLGMAAVLGIVRGHQGAIKVYSELGKGTNFKVLFPASTLPEKLHDVKSSEFGWRGQGTVLLADDEETVRSVAREMLSVLGFETLVAVDGMDALQKFLANKDSIRCVIMDLTMPHMDGEEAFRELRRVDPKIPIVMASGYNEQDVSQKFLGKGLSGFIQKPFRTSTLRSVLESCLSEAEAEN